ncbi:MAG: hypothetical protein HY708_03945 [Ignavibacteriae bacterium]|nr:hypothetical protein [Ignavibacteriota bacterium]
MSGPEILIPLTFFLSLGGIAGVHILTRHKERMSMIEKGLKSEDIKSLYERSNMRVNPLSSLKWGVVFVGIGLAVLIGMWLRQSFYFDEGIFPGLIALFGGLGLIVFYSIARNKASQ